MGYHLLSLLVTHLRFVDQICLELNYNEALYSCTHFFVQVVTWTCCLLWASVARMCSSRDDAGDGKSEVSPELCSRECSQTNKKEIRCVL
eukprot:s2733_g3.t1